MTSTACTTGVLKVRASRLNSGLVAEISWTFNQTAIDSSKNGQLVVSQAVPSDAGLYACTATNPYGKTSRETRVSVIAVPELRRVYAVRKGEGVVLPGIVPEGQLVRVEWMKDGEKIDEAK